MKINIDTVKEIIEHHFSEPAKEVNEVPGGYANYVFEAKVRSEKYIIRIAEEHMRLQYFLKEQWAVQKAKEKKIPVPEILEVANEASKFPYMIVRWIDGIPGEQARNRNDVLREMGKYTAIINTIETSGYGHIFNWSSNILSRNKTWADYWYNELMLDERIALFEKHKILSWSNMNKLKAAVKDMLTWDYEPSLNHGDMRLKNVLLNEKGKICGILDWESCSSNIAPQWDLSISLHDLGIDEKEAFLEGYGLSFTQYKKIADDIKVLNVLNYAPFVAMSYEEKNREYIENIRARLNGYFDMYSL